VGRGPPYLLKVKIAEIALSLAPPKEINRFCCGRIEIATVAALLRNDTQLLPYTIVNNK